MSVNSTRDNETGRFNISVTVLNTVPEGMTSVFYFVVNATNDAPSFNIKNQYNSTQDENFIDYINATDEESHYPLTFNISFLSNCTFASWSTRNNCTLFSYANASNTSIIINFTPVKNDVGIYYINISARDFGGNYTCSSGYCSTNYSQNKTSSYPQIIVFNVFSALEINVSDCQNKIFQENVSNTCRVNVTVRGEDDSINVSSLAFLRNYQGSVSNSSWFYGMNRTTSSNFIKTININVTPGKTEIGNWTINFTVQDLTYSQNSTQQIYIYVNRTYNDIPEIIGISNRNTSINLSTRINITVHDDDFLIPDKLQYNETINFTRIILNQSNLSQELNINNFSIQIINMTVNGTNRTEAKIEFTPNASDIGTYTINITARDRENSSVSRLFNLTIINNNAPVWNSTMQTVFLIYENNLTYFNFSQNVSDPDGDSFTFSFTNDTSFPSFSINSSTGIINFTPLDLDVGQHIVEVIASDSYLTGTKSFNFTIYNINDPVYLETPISATNASVDSNSNINVTEDNVTTITLWIQDDDFKIPSGQKSFYNETLRINLTIQGANSSLFQFVIDSSFPTPGNNRSKYDAIFTPKKNDIGNYNVTVNISDLSNNSTVLRFNLTISAIAHNPVLMNLTNQSSVISQNLYYRINATDSEDGNSFGNTNFTFSYSFLSGADIFNSTTFNSTTGIINITFNSSQGGRYRLNITVNDTSARQDFKDFWIFVYDTPAVNSPAVSYEFSLIENITSNLNFQVNHSVGDNLTYLFYITTSNTSILRYNLSYLTNGTNLTWQFTPNFTDETYSNKRNLTLIVINSNYSYLNASRTWNITINHSNAPISFISSIGDRQATYDNAITISLGSYFSDIDYSDVNYNQTVNFSIFSNSTPSYISASFSGWTLTLSSSVAVTESLNITARDLNNSNSSLTNATSSNFIVQFTAPTTTTTATPSTGGGGSTTLVPIAFKIIAPRYISAYQNKKIIIPLSLINSGQKSFENVNISSSALKDGKLENKIKTSLDKNYFKSLDSGKTENLTLTVFFETNKTGDYEIMLNATSKDPKYTDWAKILINLQKINESTKDIEELIIFTEELIVDNPECIEITEIVREARAYFEKDDFANAKIKAEQAINACREAISQAGLATQKFPVPYTLNEILIIVSAISLIFSFFYYLFKRRRFRFMSIQDVS